MLKSIVVILALVGVANACDAFPNGTDTTLNWWQSCSGNTVVKTLTTTDASGNSEYPIHLGQPLYIPLTLTNNGPAYCGDAGCTLDTYIWSWGGKYYLY